jgi:hypothetical protein
MIFRSCEHALRLPRKRRALSNWKRHETAECPCWGIAAGGVDGEVTSRPDPCRPCFERRDGGERAREGDAAASAAASVGETATAALSGFLFAPKFCKA